MKKETGICKLNGRIGNYEKVYGKTASGGDYTILYYMDDDFELCSKGVATKCKIYEVTNEGKILSESEGVINK